MNARWRPIVLTALSAAVAAVSLGGGAPNDIDALARAVMETQRVPGMSLAVLRHGSVLALKAYGTADLENDVPVTEETEFSIASITKQFTAAAVLQLAERGLLSLDDDISRFLPDYPVRNAGITIRRLLNHTAGVRNLQDLGARYWKQAPTRATPQEVIDLFKSEPLDFRPGTDYHYSNSGYILLGAVIERASGESFGDYLSKHLLKPLGLQHTIYPETSALIPHRARGYWIRENAFINAASYDDSQGFSMGGLYSDAKDLARWTDALHHGRVLKPESYREMITPSVLPDGEKLSYGFGMELGEIEGKRVLSHGGGGVGFIAQAIDIPEDELVIVALTNTSFGGGAIEMADQVMRKLLGIPGPVDLPLPAEMAKRYAGRYRMGTDLVEIVRDGDHLVVRYSREDVHRLRYQGGGVFAQDGRLARLQVREQDGRVEGFVIARYGAVLSKAVRDN